MNSKKNSVDASPIVSQRVSVFFFRKKAELKKKEVEVRKLAVVFILNSVIMFLSALRVEGYLLRMFIISF